MTQVNRLERRKARTRAALVGAAQTFVAEGRFNAPVLEITQAADVGMGSFYNHFDSKEDLFRAAVDDALESVGAYLDTVTVDLTDPVEMFTQSFRLTGRLFRLEPELSRVLLNSASILLSSPHSGLAPRSLRDIRAGADSGRFVIEDAEVALALVSGSMLALGRLLTEHPERDDEAAVDAMASSVLRALGVSAAEAITLCARPLPPSSVGALRTILEESVLRRER
ncbi:TetR/AcrR family transcriptional regulator [Rhodococcus sp. BP-349]|uniref:TetR/AcrR family transcriptional regulator n=1 Tax=unclassified Rhodococcus (in: high G+C Gram-positive bacteria) TaxID=192944 RepID=UPI001C9B3B15|nr:MULTISPECIES: TetR/AcrR family transcriptional regulator [unclassified Rhodococcus (in: high G+C Gram-positive bacteria)]MBY6537916.1 TetR/AcrR family transcriptional regulator [Rhodococcus sp. BP-363]MBY6542253.1 TetR/AcrR family transcriptional regulator [Rhodococcus sp. BP-369]MBY6561483.1 TetR/AcrR family transcriptional regulator [Rhodococcus sp. BP-370]MBY6575775.1 TetR/AcrR family transcriptional regulator [Rhodococcus sp. BP-364]MBY6585076.1 TetR/AcrR family transcriptional regulato